LDANRKESKIQANENEEDRETTEGSKKSCAFQQGIGISKGARPTYFAATSIQAYQGEISEPSGLSGRAKWPRIDAMSIVRASNRAKYTRNTEDAQNLNIM
jgi:hypothetical protein